MYFLQTTFKLGTSSTLERLAQHNLPLFILLILCFNNVCISYKTTFKIGTSSTLERLALQNLHFLILRCNQESVQFLVITVFVYLLRTTFKLTASSTLWRGGGASQSSFILPLNIPYLMQLLLINVLSLVSITHFECFSNHVP